MDVETDIVFDDHIHHLLRELLPWRSPPRKSMTEARAGPNWVATLGDAWMWCRSISITELDHLPKPDLPAIAAFRDRHPRRSSPAASPHFREPVVRARALGISIEVSVIPGSRMLPGMVER
jgi:hypothetical protein